MGHGIAEKSSLGDVYELSGCPLIKGLVARNKKRSGDESFLMQLKRIF